MSQQMILWGALCCDRALGSPRTKPHLHPRTSAMSGDDAVPRDARAIPSPTRDLQSDTGDGDGDDETVNGIGISTSTSISAAKVSEHGWARSPVFCCLKLESRT